jgi:DNA-binding MarR family transcriptional regulator
VKRGGNARQTSGARGAHGTLDVLQLIWALDHALQVRSAWMARELGVTGPQRLVLRLVAAGLVDSPGELARRLVVHRSTVTGIVSRLEQRRLLKRSAHERDGRRQKLVLTAAGRRLALPHPGAIEAAVDRALSEARPREVRQGSVLLRALADALMVNTGATSRDRRVSSGAR